MKKSELYYLAMIAVVNTPTISPEKKIEVLKVLAEDESIALFTEEREEKAAEEE